MIYVYPAEFDTKVIHRKTLVVYTLVAIIAFQVVMYLIVGLLLSERISIYLFAIVIVQVMVILTMLEFVRKPWDGKEMEIEKVINLNHNNIFDSLSSYAGSDDDDPSFSQRLHGMGVNFSERDSAEN